MKWYKHDPSAALAGMIGLTVEERGAYYTVIDLLYARAPHSDVTDDLVIKALAIRPKTWRRLKASLMAKGKVHETAGKLSANRVVETVMNANSAMVQTRELRLRQLKNQELKLNGNAWRTRTTSK